MRFIDKHRQLPTVQKIVTGMRDLPQQILRQFWKWSTLFFNADERDDAIEAIFRFLWWAYVPSHSLSQF